MDTMAAKTESDWSRQQMRARALDPAGKMNDAIDAESDGGVLVSTM